MATLIRLTRRGDRPALLRCIANLQDAERVFEPRLRPGRLVAAAYYAQLRRRCGRWHGQIFVAEQDDEVVGFVAVAARVPFTELDDPPGTYALVTDLVVGRRYRRQGLGGQLLAQAERYARRCGATELQIGVLAANQPGARLYRQAGFRPAFQLLRKRICPPVAEAAADSPRRQRRLRVD
jgi:ribosomal protein S18 acetylase RimI-like enzyme